MLTAYAEARKWAIENPAELKALLAKAAKLPEDVVARQLERTKLSYSPIGEEEASAVVAAGEALAKAGVIPAETDVKGFTAALIDRSFDAKVAETTAAAK